MFIADWLDFIVCSPNWNERINYHPTFDWKTKQ